MDDHTLRVLEFHRVLALLANETVFSVGRELALELRPATTFIGTLSLQRRTAEMRLLDQMGIDIPFNAARDIRPTIHAAEIAQGLDASELLAAAQMLKTAMQARRVVERVAERVPELAVIASDIADFRRFTIAVEEAITDRGEVADRASEQLFATRRELRLAQERLDQRAQAALADAVRRGIAQEGLLTERNGRKVIPIKADYRGQLTGIVHDVSSSGATVFVEPMGVVEAGNQVRELQLAEEREVRRILLRIASVLGGMAGEAQRAVLAMAHFDVLTAAVRLGKRLKAQLPPPGDATSWLAAEGPAVLVRARHPLLRGEAVPIGLEVGGSVRGLVVTGPNTGGKTVALKTLGLLTLMAQAGLPVPCDEGSRFVVFSQVYADIGDEQSIEQSLSTFSSHMRNITAILEKARPGTLVLLDELGAGTDPTEGAALARAILETLMDRGCTIMATTHHGELKAYAHNEPRLRNASVEFDVETLSPTYHLTIGLPGQSNAIAIAQRLGLDEDVLEKAREQLSPEHFEFEQLLAEIREERIGAAEARHREELARRESEELRLALAERRDRIEQERADILAAAHREAEDAVASAQRALAEIKRQAARRDFDTQAAEETLKQLDTGMERLRARARPEREKLAPVTAAVRDIAPGDLIHVRDIPQEGEALSGIGDDGKVEAQFGSIRMKVSVDRIDRVQPGRAGEKVVLPAGPQVPIELDLRGKRAEEALTDFETYVDDAFRAGLPFIRIIHGKGTGALRAAIRDALRGHPLVRRYEAAAPNEGGEGVTIAVLAG
ncbi:MAG: endonuclease MutS2 [Thermoflexaceae bacterium]|nr:endonuclease MutS2 [Thermoflexaceae bacterium]